MASLVIPVQQDLNISINNLDAEHNRVDFRWTGSAAVHTGDCSITYSFSVADLAGKSFETIAGEITAAALALLTPE